MAQKIFRVRVVTYKLCKQSARQGGDSRGGGARNYEPFGGGGGSTATADEKCDPRQYLQLKN